MASRTNKPNPEPPQDMPTVVVADQTEPTPPPSIPPADGVLLTRHEFVENYLPFGPERRMAEVLLPDTQMGLGEWRERWRIALNSPAP